MSAPGVQDPGLPVPGGTLLEMPVEEDTRVALEEGDHERFSHFVAKEKLVEAMVNGTPVVALCGKVWVPSRDPQRFPVCPTCKEIWDSLPNSGGRGDGGGAPGDGGPGR